MNSRSRLLAVTIVAAFLPQAAKGAGIDCSRADTTVERDICADAGLRERDRLMSTLYATGLASDDKDKMRTAQEKWLRTLTACRDAACIRQNYDARIVALSSDRANKARAVTYRRAGTDGGEAMLSIVGLPDGMAEASLSSIYAAPGAETTGEVYASGADGVIDLRKGSGDFQADGGCIIRFRRLDDRTWHVVQKGTCNFASHIDLQGAYRR